jgi:hypothetical protein
MEFEKQLLDEVRQLRQQDNGLRAEIKAKQIKLAAIQESIVEAEQQASIVMRKAEVAQQQRLAELERERVPLEEAHAASKARLAEQDALYAKRVSEHQQALTDAQHEKMRQLQSLEKQIEERIKRQDAINKAITLCQKKVAEL